MSFIASPNPHHEPAYLRNCGLRAWNRIFTRSSGATTVLACQTRNVSQCPHGCIANGMRPVECRRVEQTYRTSGQAPCYPRSPDVIQTPFLLTVGILLRPRYSSLIVCRTDSYFALLFRYPGPQPERIGCYLSWFVRCAPRHGGMADERRGHSL